VRLHQEQEAALKDALREAERAAERTARAGSAVDMEYLKNTVIKVGVCVCGCVYCLCWGLNLLRMRASVCAVDMEYLKNTVIKVCVCVYVAVCACVYSGCVYVRAACARACAFASACLRLSCTGCGGVADGTVSLRGRCGRRATGHVPRPTPLFPPGCTQLFLTGEAETLLPVFASILSLSPDEVKRCRDGVDALARSEVPMAAAAAAVDSATSWLGGWGWIAGGGGGAAAASGGGGGGSGGGVATPKGDAK
jgi:uncharacterized membrane protein YgcG